MKERIQILGRTVALFAKEKANCEISVDGS